jgi:hypothetical protein
MKLPAPVRTLVADLIERRLWPVALALVVALVAVPAVLLGGSPAAQDAPLAATPAVPAAEQGGDAAVTLTDRGQGVAAHGAKRDPFTQPKVKKAKVAPVTGATAPGGTSASGATSGSTGGATTDLSDIGVVPVGGATGGTGSGTSTKKSDSAAQAKDSWHVDLRFGKNGSKLTSRTDVPRLSPLPSQADPFFVYLGVAADGKTAMFLVSSDAVPTGDGACKPAPDNCDRVDMQAGDSEFFDVTTPDGQTVQYQLDLVRVSRTVSADAAVAKAARSRESAAGREVLREAVATKQVDVSDLAYSQQLGLVIPTGAGARNSALFGGYRVDLQFGEPGQLVKRYNLARLTPLPSVDDPSFVFLGVLGDGRTALFLNPSQAAAAGDAVCEPTPQECQRVKLEAGKSATFAAQAIDGSTSQYQLDIDGITPVKADTPEEAAASRTRESTAGRVVLRRLITEVGSLVGDLTFSGGKGVVEPAAEGSATSE